MSELSFSTGIRALDNLLGGLRPGDNLVFHVPAPGGFEPFVLALRDHCRREAAHLVYAKVDSSLEEALKGLPEGDVFDVVGCWQGAEDFVQEFKGYLQGKGRHVYYVFDNFTALRPLLGGEEALTSFFLELCPLLYQLETIAYWPLLKGQHAAGTIAAIRDATQIFLDLSAEGGETFIKPLKVWGRYSESMFAPHRLTVEDGLLTIAPVLEEEVDWGSYAAQLREKSQELSQRNKELAALNAIVATVSQSLDLDEVLNSASEKVLQLTGFEVVEILLLDEVTGELRMAAHRGISQEVLQELNRIKMGEGFTGWVAASGQPIVVENISEDPRLTRTVAAKESFRTLASMPLESKGKVLGAMNLGTRSQRLLTAEETASLVTIGQQIGVAVENARLYEQTQQALGTKSALLQEMHHRIKNNLQAITGLLSLQLAYKESTTVEEVVRTTINRIRSIASVHESLSYDEVGSVGFRNLARRITELSREGMVQASQRVQVSFVGPDLKLPSKQATSLALVLNELAVNAIKHGFAGGRDGTITVRTSTEGDQMALEVLDDGLGLPEGFDPRQSSGLGLRIVEILVRRDLKGNFTLENVGGGGTRAVIAFPVEASKG